MSNVSHQHETLSDTVRPTHYKLSLRDLNFDDWTYAGTVIIELELLKSTSVIGINSLDIELLQATLAIEQEGAVATFTASKISTSDDDQLTKIAFEREIPPNQKVSLRCEFKAHLGTSMNGFYRCKYKPLQGATNSPSVPHNGDGWNYMLSSFEFDIEIPTGLMALSNTPISQVVASSSRSGFEVVSFEKTPSMGTYILAWAVGDFEYLEGATNRNYGGKPVPIRIYTSPGLSCQGEWALEHAIKCLDLFSEKFEIDYPLAKCDFIAVHDMSFGAMENWGLVTSRPEILLYDPAKSGPSFKRSVATTVAHELAHMWFGNLVTMKWWDELWLNESFAEWASYYALHILHPEWNIWVYFLTVSIEPALHLDGMRTSHPVHVPVQKGQDAEQVIDLIAYKKGCSILHMLTEYIGADVCLSGVNKYLKRHSYGSASSGDLWSAIGLASGQDIAAIMKSWIEKIGYPVVEVSEAPSGQLHVKQSRFLLTGDAAASEDETIWWIPLAIRDEKGIRSTVLNTKEMTIQNVDKDFFLLNSGGTGLYRVKYSDSRLVTLSKQLDRLSTPDRLSLLGSIHASALSGGSTVASILSFIRDLYFSSEPVIWRRMLRIVEAIIKLFDEEADILKGLRTFGVKLAHSGLEALDNCSNQEDKDRLDEIRADLTELGAAYGSERLKKETLLDFEAWRQNPDSLEAHRRSLVFRTAARYMPGTAFEVLREYWEDTTAADEKLLALWGISGIGDEELFRSSILPFNFEASPVNHVVAPANMRMIVHGISEHPILRYIQ